MCIIYIYRAIPNSRFVAFGLPLARIPAHLGHLLQGFGQIAIFQSFCSCLQWAPRLSVPARHGGTPIAGWFLFGKIPSFEMDDDWGYPYFRTPLYYPMFPILSHIIPYFPYYPILIPISVSYFGKLGRYLPTRPVGLTSRPETCLTRFCHCGVGGATQQFPVPNMGI